MPRLLLAVLSLVPQASAAPVPAERPVEERAETVDRPGRAPINAGLYRRLDELYLKRHRDGAPAEAVGLVEKALRTSPLDPGLLWRYGRARVVAGDRSPGGRGEHFLSAEQALRTALDIEGGLVEARYWLASALLRRARYRSALDQVERALERAPDEARLHHLAGDILWKAPRLGGGDRARAVAEFEKALALSGRYAAHYLSLAEAYWDLGRESDAAAVVRRLDRLKNAADPSELADGSQRLIRLRGSLDL
jgi:tetratricopeptide (TPR) repeat protein